MKEQKCKRRKKEREGKNRIGKVHAMKIGVTSSLHKNAHTYIGQTKKYLFNQNIPLFCYIIL